MKEIKGIMPALVTPLNNDRTTLNTDALKSLIRYHKSLGADGFYIAGATGESLALSMETKKLLIEKSIEEIGEEPLKIMHIADMNFENTKILARHAEACGADVISAIPPIYFAYDQNDIYNYYKEIAAQVSIPLMLYYTPAANATLSTELFSRLAEIDNITSVKWTMPSYNKVVDLLAQTDLAVVNGPDEMLVSGLAAGCAGGIGTTYNVMLPLFKEIYTLWGNGNTSEALEVQKRANKVINVLVKHKVIPATKLLLEYMGFEVGDASFPMTSYSIEDKKKIVSEIITAGFKF